MFITPSFKKSLIVEQFQRNYLKQPSSLLPPAEETQRDALFPPWTFFQSFF